MDENPALPDEERGLYPKYLAIKIPDGDKRKAIQVVGGDSGEPWASFEEVTEPFFLLKFDDPYAQDALLAYARSCESYYPKLASDIRKKVMNAKLGGKLQGMVEEIDRRMETTLSEKENYD